MGKCEDSVTYLCKALKKAGWNFALFRITHRFEGFAGC